MAQVDFDVLIIGAGLSGIGVARYLKVKCPGKTFAILEEKPRIGGTWDQFRYPGIRSDSDMHTMGYAFKPWTKPKAIADGESILSYVKEAAAENDLTPHIRFDRRVTAAAYDSATQRWTLTVDHGGETEILTCNFMLSCAGYYDHHAGYLPEWDGYADYKGQLVHPQFWPEDLDYTGKRIAVIGSGATAVTLLPSLAQKAAHVVQVQRSPTYVINRPAQDKYANWMHKYLPHRLAYMLARWRIILDGRMRRKKMAANIKGTKKFFIRGVAQELGDTVDWKTHFVPDYWPGQQRICAVPDGDMFAALRSGKASMVTGTIARFTENGLLMQDGSTVQADIIVTATGLNLQFMGGMDVQVDGAHVNPGNLLIFKGFMYSNVPNMIYFSGYTNASWTLKVDLVADYACRLLRHMDATGQRQVVARAGAPELAQKDTAIKFISGYFARSAHKLPKHGKGFPWIHEQDYLWDRKTLKRGRVDDGSLEFSRGRAVDLPAEQRRNPTSDLAAE